MYYIRVEAHFDAAHFLAGYEGKCANIHGHRWRVVCQFGAQVLQMEGPARGMVRDFVDVKGILKELCGQMDHKLIYETGTMEAGVLEALEETAGFSLMTVGFRPTAENFARYFYDSMAEKLGDKPYSVEVYETPENCAIYMEGKP